MAGPDKTRLALANLRQVRLAEVRAISSALFRIVALPILVTLTCRDFRALRPLQTLLEAIAAMGIVLPFFFAWTRTTSARIRIGRDSAARADWHGAIAALKIFGAPNRFARLFDATGEARFHLGQALVAVGDSDGERILSLLTRDLGSRTEWSRSALDGIQQGHETQ